MIWFGMGWRRDCGMVMCAGVLWRLGVVWTGCHTWNMVLLLELCMDHDMSLT